MGVIKGMLGAVIAVPVLGAALGGIGTSMGAIGGGVAGIGSATQTLVSAGFIGHVAKSSGVTKLFK